MRLARMHRHTTIGFNMTPMIDIVFLLIIFFITASQITPLVNFPVQLPVVASRAEAPRLIPATVNIDRDGAYIVARQRWELDQVVRWLEKLVQENNSPQTQLQILIRADRNARSEQVNRLLPKLTELGIREIKFSVSGTGSVAESAGD